jgi:hypothetical protein
MCHFHSGLQTHLTYFGVQNVGKHPAIVLSHPHPETNLVEVAQMTHNAGVLVHPKPSADYGVPGDSNIDLHKKTIDQQHLKNLPPAHPLKNLVVAEEHFTKLTNDIGMYPCA